MGSGHETTEWRKANNRTGPGLWDQLKAFLRERRIPLAGNKAELVKKVADIVYTDSLEEENRSHFVSMCSVRSSTQL